MTNKRFLTLADLLQTEIDKLSDDVTFDYTDTSDRLSLWMSEPRLPTYTYNSLPVKQISDRMAWHYAL